MFLRERIRGKIMSVIKSLMMAMILLSISACGGGSSGTTTETVTGLSTADNTQLLDE